MARYPLEWGWHTDPAPKNDTDSSDTAASWPATQQRYPLEWGWDAPAEPDAPALPTFTPVMQTLLGGADPESLPRAPGITPVSTGSGDTASDIPDTNTALHEDGAQIAQAKPRQASLQQKPQMPWQPTPEEVIPGIERNAKIWDDIVHAREGQVPKTVQPMLPDNWEQFIDKINPNYSKWTREAAQRNGIPPELLARMLWKESKYDARALNPSTNAAGIAQLLPSALQDLNIDPRKFSYSDAKSSIDAGAAYLARLYGQFKDWPKAVAAYNWGGGNLQKWLNGWNGKDFMTGVKGPSAETKATLYHIFRGNPGAFDR
ncbi:MAG TPA: transglycosylase SLT domain-containing protein [Reyranella sp.]|jgi:hypothetical protein|nr:transglycosylase SLT domain-containing protein [Reyranella sp.]